MGGSVVVFSNALALVCIFLCLNLAHYVFEVLGITFSLLGNLAVVESAISLGNIYFGFYSFYLGVDALGIYLGMPTNSLYICGGMVVESGS